MVVKLIVSYRGTRYAGWQRQNNALAVQEVVESAIAEVVGHPVRIHGAGRTDAGVHASGQVTHLTLDESFPLKGLLYGGNRHLPVDVRLLAAERMPDGFDARRCATGKSYAFHLHRGRVVPALDADRRVQVTPELDVDAIRDALERLPGCHDFTAFAAAGGSHGQPFRRIFAATADVDGAALTLRFIGDGFLRGMVRALVGTLVDVGRGRRSVDDFTDLLAGRPRCEAGATAPAHGLVLERVFYPPRWRALESVSGS